MPILQLANDFQIKTEKVPDSSPEVYFAVEWSAATPAARASRVVVSGVVHRATETSGVLGMQFRLEVFGSADGLVWVSLGSPANDLIATFVDAAGTRCGAPNAFASPAYLTAGFGWIRVRWMLYPLTPSTALMLGQSLDFTAQAGLERG